MISRILKDNHFLSLAANGFTAVFGLLSFMLLARAYSQESFGLWVLYLTGFSFVEMFKAGLLHAALVKHVAGKPIHTQKQFIGASWKLGIVLSVGIVLLTYTVYIFFPEIIASLGLTLFFKYYPILSLVNLPINYSIWISQSKNNFKPIMWIRFSIAFGFFMVVLINMLNVFDLEYLVIGHLALHGLMALILLISSYSGIQFLSFSSKKHREELLNFGKYSFGTLIGTNLLKSADTFLIGFFIGPAAVALYSIPLRLTEMMEIPLRSLVSNALPKISAASNQNDMPKVKSIFYQYAGILTIFFIPFMVLAFIYAEELVVLTGGEQYKEAAIIFRVFCVYGLFLSIDRFTGVTLDAINKPKYNLYKVIGMAIINILGDVIILLTIESLWAVAMITILTVLTGVFAGFFFLNRHIKISIGGVIKSGIQFFALKIFKKQIGTINN